MIPEGPPPAAEPGKPWSDELAQWYADNFGEHPINGLAVEAAGLTEAETVLDIGCGSGAAVRAAATILPQGKVIGLDPTPAMIRIAKEQTEAHPARSRIAFVEAGAEEMPIDDAGIDVVIAACSLHHWFDIPKGMSEVVRVLRPDGRFIVVEEIFEQADRGMSAQEIKELIEASGFKIVEWSEHQQTDWRANVFLAQLRKGPR